MTLDNADWPTPEELDRARLTVAVFRPDDDRLREAVELVASLGATPVPDPMLEVQPTGATPREYVDGSEAENEDGSEAGNEKRTGTEDENGDEYVIFTSKTGVELATAAGWTPGNAIVCAIGDRTARALRESGYRVDRIPEEYTSSGLVAELTPAVRGARVEVARSDHGSDVLLDGLREAGATVHETVLYRLVRPEGSGRSAELAAAGDLDAAAFTSSLTVEHFLEAAADRGVRTEAIDGLNDCVVGAIGDPTRRTAQSRGIDVDVVPDTADFEELACDVVETAAPTRQE